MCLSAWSFSNTFSLSTCLPRRTICNGTLVTERNKFHYFGWTLSTHPFINTRYELRHLLSPAQYQFRAFCLSMFAMSFNFFLPRWSWCVVAHNIDEWQTKNSDTVFLCSCCEMEIERSVHVVHGICFRWILRTSFDGFLPGPCNLNLTSQSDSLKVNLIEFGTAKKYHTSFDIFKLCLATLWRTHASPIFQWSKAIFNYYLCAWCVSTTAPFYTR